MCADIKELAFDLKTLGKIDQAIWLVSNGSAIEIAGAGEEQKWKVFRSGRKTVLEVGG